MLGYGKTVKCIGFHMVSMMTPEVSTYCVCQNDEFSFVFAAFLRCGSAKRPDGVFQNHTYFSVKPSLLIDF